jgi:ribonuclease T2
MMRIVRWLAAIAIVQISQLAYLGAASAEGQPGEFDYYSMALSWSPTYCAARVDSRPNEPQCASERPFAFVLHGLWPQYERGWPQFCETGERPWVPNEVIRDMLDIMPSKRLIIHQYRKHGVCSGLDPEGYFRVARQAFERIRIPARFQSPQDYQMVTPEEIERAFLDANPALTPDMIAIDCKNRRLRELRICLTHDLKFKACGPNEEQKRLCKAEKIVMPPVRAGAGRSLDADNEDGDRDERDDYEPD